jgi:pimeloyl-ACP methyl ester carboxylesterase
MLAAKIHKRLSGLILCFIIARAVADSQARQPSGSSSNSNIVQVNNKGSLEIAGNVITGPLDAPDTAELRKKEAAVKDMGSYTTRGVTFDCSGMQCGATLYLPKSPAKGSSSKGSSKGSSKSSSSLPPVIVMAHGLGGEKTWLAKFASVFAEGGFAVLAFDYRHWGSSDGQPRQWISIAKQHQDWFAAVKHVQTQMGALLDASRLSLWGTSFAGGHVIVVASKLPGQIKAVISNVSTT